MEPVRILLDDSVPELLQNMVAGLLPSEPPCKVIAAARARIPLDQQIRETAPDMIVVLNPAHDNAPDRFEQLLRSRPSLRVLALTPVGGMAFLHWLKPHVCDIGQLSSASLRSAVLQARTGLQAGA